MYKIYMGFSKPKNHPFPVVSWLVRLFQWTKYSHVYVRWFSKGAEMDVCYHASGSSLNFLGKMAFDKKIDTLHEFEIDLTKEEYRKLLKFCMTYAGTDYGKKQIVGMAIVRLFGLKSNPLADGRKSQVCSEVAGHILEDIKGIKTGLDLEVDGPEELFEFLDKCCKEEKYSWLRRAA